MSDRGFKGAIFDLDGVITASAHLHSRAWKAMFDEFLEGWTRDKGEPFQEFTENDYLEFVDGKPRYQGVKSFLESRGVSLPFGDPDDPPDKLTYCGLGNRKNVSYQKQLEENGAQVFETSVALVKELRELGYKVGVASSSKNTKLVLEQTGLEELFETRVCGLVSEELGLKGKPDPDIFVKAADNLGLEPNECMMVEDAISGVQAGRTGNFGLVLGVARHMSGDELLANGADVVVADLGEIAVSDLEAWFKEGIEDDSWFLTYHSYRPKEEKLREALTVVGNGYMGTRGSIEGERASEHHYPGTYIAGLYNKLPTEVHGRVIYNNDFVNIPNWTIVEFAIGEGEYISPLDMEVLSYRHRLNMLKGLMERTIVVRDKAGRIMRVRSRRMVSMKKRHIAGLQFSVTPLNFSGVIKIRSAIDGSVINDGVDRYRQLASEHLEGLEAGELSDGAFVHVRTKNSKFDILVSSKEGVCLEGKSLDLKGEVETKDFETAKIYRLDAVEGKTLTLDKVVGVFASVDPALKDVKKAGEDFVAGDYAFQRLMDESAAEWRGIWERADVQILGDRFCQRVARLHAFHLLVTASPHNRELDAGMPARGLHGEAYRGHVFWDEVYIFPFYNWTFPDITKSLLRYRYRRLDAAREYARENGFKGAMYPWQTADDGSEETQILHYNPVSDTWGPDLSRRQRHVNIAVFYNIVSYWEQTGDDEFLKDFGLEMLLEVARFWSDISKKSDVDGRYHIAGVMGPDEYHEKLPGSEEEGVRDNAYTNIMVAWLMKEAVRLLDEWPDSIVKPVADKISFTKEETQRWREISEKMYVPIVEGGIISQFEGYMDLKELDWDAYRRKYGNIHRMDRILKAEGDNPDNYKVSKQADVLMTFYLLSPQTVKRILEKLGYELGDAIELLKKNYDYYLDRTSHGSTLSKVVHAAIAKDMGVRELTWKWFMEAMKSDINDTQGGTTLEGIHAGVMAGTLGVIIRNFAGVSFEKNEVVVQPNLPNHWKRLSFNIQNRGVRYFVEITDEQAMVRVEENGEVQTIQTSPGQHRVLDAVGDSRIMLDYRKGS